MIIQKEDLVIVLCSRGKRKTWVNVEWKPGFFHFTSFQFDVIYGRARETQLGSDLGIWNLAWGMFLSK